MTDTQIKEPVLAADDTAEKLKVLENLYRDQIKKSLIQNEMSLAASLKEDVIGTLTSVAMMGYTKGGVDASEVIVEEINRLKIAAKLKELAVKA